MYDTSQMEAARILAQEFKSKGNSRRGGGAGGGGRDELRGGGSTCGVGAGRSLNTPRSQFSRSSMTRPMPSRPALSVGNVNKTPTRIDPSLAGWLGGQNADDNKPAKSVPITTKKATVSLPVDPKLSSWLTNSSQPQPLSVTPVPDANGTPKSNTSASEVTTDVQSAIVSQAQSILEEPMRVTVQIQNPTSPAANKTYRDKPKTSDCPFEKKTTSASKCDGLGKSIWASEDPATVRTQDKSSDSGPVVDAAMSSRASAMPQEQQPICSPAASYDGQVSRLLEMGHNKDKTQKAARKTGSKLLLHQQPKVGTLLWALQQLDAGLELPDPQQLKAHGYRLNDNCPHVQPVAASQSDVNDAISQSQSQKTGNDENNNVLMDEVNCHCPKRSHPVIGLAASKYNTDVDGDVDISGMSTTARNKFAVNVILHDHSMPDCPVLLRTKTKYPLYFGANPATVNDDDDGLSVTVWEGQHRATPSAATPSAQQPQPRPQQQSDGGRGLKSSIWAT
ncbi:hypothetical protein LZ30DRAFT_777885 [Colletotrichum cereale]|nr:hypothetical protein LZ30DRAFT_777885 [Colletotrichum cereale]